MPSFGTAVPHATLPITRIDAPMREQVKAARETVGLRQKDSAVLFNSRFAIHC
jgi:hypothetical protein